MSKKNAPATRTVAQVTPDAVNRSQMIRDYHSANPNAGPSEIARALSTDGMKISAALVGQVLNGRSKKSKGMDVNTIKAAASFVKAYKGKVEDAAAAIESVGQFIDACGSSEAAREALTTFKEVSSVIA